MPDAERLIIADDARGLVQRHAVVVEQVAALLGQRLRDEPVRAVRIERAHEPDEPEDGGLVFRVLIAGEVEEAQHLWERIEQDLSELQRRLLPEQSRELAGRVEVIVDWSG